MAMILWEPNAVDSEWGTPPEAAQATLAEV
jgi:hypothetical protein